MHLEDVIDCPEKVTRRRTIMELCEIEELYLEGYCTRARGREEELRKNVRKAISLGRTTSDALKLCKRESIRSPDRRFRLLPKAGGLPFPTAVRLRGRLLPAPDLTRHGQLVAVTVDVLPHELFDH